jgi:hypothetical protein
MSTYRYPIEKLPLGTFPPGRVVKSREWDFSNGTIPMERMRVGSPTATTGTNVVAQTTNRVLADGTTVWVTSAGTSGLTVERPYYVIASGGSTFQLALSPEGSAVAIAATGAITIDAFLASFSATGTFAVASPSTTIGYAQVTTTAVSGNTAHFRSEIGLALGAVEAVLWEVEGFILTEHNPVADIFLRIQQVGATPGVYAVQRSTETFMRLGISGDVAGTETPSEFDVRGGIQAANNTPKNFGIFLNCRTKELFLLDADRRVLAYRDLASGFSTPTDARPSFAIITREAVAKVLRVKKLRQTWWVD